MNFGIDDIIILLGAGCSKEAGILTSNDMIKKIEDLIIESDEWKPYKDLYYYIKSSIYYCDGILGRYDNCVNFNIERFVNTLAELEKKDEHTIYPFVGAWNIKLIELAGYDFKKIKELRGKIIKKLKNWVTLNNYAKANYYAKFLDFRHSYNYPLRIFSLNYDLCLEKNIDSSQIERGFDDNRKWDWRRFDDNENSGKLIYLYKMHGSIDWERDENKILTFSDTTDNIESPDLIFGTIYKLQYIDPYLFYTYQFRRYTLGAKLVITIGYGFGDEHINGILGQALNTNPQKKILCVLYDEDENNKKREIINKLNLRNNEQVEYENIKAKEFIENYLTIDTLNKVFPKDEEFII